jgi:hypothetical protein
MKGLGQEGFTPEAGDKIAKYTKAVLEVSYASPVYKVLGDGEIDGFEGNRFTSVAMRQNATYLSVPTGSFKWSDGPTTGAKIPVNVGKIQTSLELRVTWWSVSEECFDFEFTQDNIGKVNDASFICDGLPFECDAGTLLLFGAEFERLVLPFTADSDVRIGTRGYNITWVLLYRKTRHDRFFNYDPANDGLNAGYYQGSVNGIFYLPGAFPDGKLLYDQFRMTDLWRCPD